MDKIISIALNDLRISFKEPSIWINLVVIPVALILLIGAVTGGFGGDDGEPRVRVDVFDNDQSAQSEALLQTIRDLNATLLLCPMDDDEDGICGLDGETLDVELAQTRVTDSITDGFIEIPQGFGEDVLSGEPASIIYRTDGDITDPGIAQQTVQAAVQQVGGAAVAARTGVLVYEDNFEFDDEAAAQTFRQNVYQQATDYWENPPAVVSYQTTVETEDDNGGTNQGFGQSVPGMGSMYVMFTVLAGAVLLIQERRNWTLQRLITMPITRTQLLGGKLLARFLMGMIQYSVAFGFGIFLGVNFGDSPLGLLLIMIAFAMCMTALAFMLSTFVSNEEQANGVVLFVSLTAAPLGGAWWPLEVVPEFMRVAGHISPVAWAMDGFNELIFYSGTLADVLLPIAVLAAMTLAFFAVAVFRFRYE
jgi:ABC-2 type transport system permease protein